QPSLHGAQRPLLRPRQRGPRPRVRARPVRDGRDHAAEAGEDAVDGRLPGTQRERDAGQRSDAASGLDYYGARYYDPLAGQFASADNVLPGGGLDLLGLSRYAYVEGNPEGRTDPTGHRPSMGGDTECDPRGCDRGFRDPGSGECLGLGCGRGSNPSTYHPPKPQPSAPKPRDTRKQNARPTGCADVRA